MYVFPRDIPMSGGDLLLVPELTFWSYQPVEASDYTQWSFSVNLLKPKGGGSFILEIQTNRRHQVYLRRLCGPCFVFKRFCKMKLGDQCWRYTQLIIRPVLGGFYLVLVDAPSSSVIWKSSGPLWSPEGATVRGYFFKLIWSLWESYQMDIRSWEEKEM